MGQSIHFFGIPWHFQLLFHLPYHFQFKRILFADDTELVYFQNIMNDVLVDLNNWFKANKLSLNVDKTNYIKFAIKNKICFSWNLGSDNKFIAKVKANTFLGLQIDINLNFK
jgi:hypothetical protein